MRTMAAARTVLALACALAAAGCGGNGADRPYRASGYVEATEVRLAPEVGGRLVEVLVDEGDRVAPGDRLARLETADTELALRRVSAERDQAAAQLRLLEAGARPEDVRQARAQLESAEADVRAAEVELAAAHADFDRFDALLQVNAGSRKQRDDAAARRDVAAARVSAARERARAARETLARLQAGTRAEEIAAARARVAAVDAQVATIEKALADAEVTAPAAGIVTARLADPGELVAPGTPLVVVTDLDRAWANVYVDQPIVPRLRIGQPVVVLTDAGDRIPGTVSFVSPRAEFTPRNVQTAEERSRLVYRIKVAVDNREGTLKVGMPVEAEIDLERR